MKHLEAHRADRIAEREAGESREYDEHWQETSWVVEKAEDVREAAVWLGDTKRRLADVKPAQKPVATMTALRGVRDSVIDLRRTLQEFVEADDAAENKLGSDPLDHDSAADHDPDLVRRARQLAEAMGV